MKLQYFLPGVVALVLVACGAGPRTADVPAATEPISASAAGTEPSATIAPLGDAASGEKVITTNSGLQYVIVEEGTGPKAEPGDIERVN